MSPTDLRLGHMQVGVRTALQHQQCLVPGTTGRERRVPREQRAHHIYRAPRVAPRDSHRRGGAPLRRLRRHAAEHLKGQSGEVVGTI